MALAKPVVVSDAKPLVRIVTECRCGEVFVSNSPGSFAEAVVRTRSIGGDYGENGRRAVFEKYNWEISSKPLITLYETLAQEKQ
jgi:glycosyltransferase involved in cell wall biosynthesis